MVSTHAGTPERFGAKADTGGVSPFDVFRAESEREELGPCEQDKGIFAPTSNLLISRRHDVLNITSSQTQFLDVLRHGELKAAVAAHGINEAATIVNAIANAVADGKKVLFVSENEVAIEAVNDWLKAAGLGDLCLQLRKDSTQKSVLEELARSLKLGEPRMPDQERTRAEHATLEAALNSHAKSMSREIGRSGFTAYEALSAFVALRNKHGTHVLFNESAMSGWDKETYLKARTFVKELELVRAELGTPVKHPFFGVGLSHISETRREELKHAIEEAFNATNIFLQSSETLLKRLRLPENLSGQELDRVIDVLQVVDQLYTENGALLKAINLENGVWVFSGENLIRIAADEMQLSQMRVRSNGSIEFGALEDLNLDLIESAINNRKGKGMLSRVFDSAYRNAMRELAAVTSVPEGLDEQLEIVKLLRHVQNLVRGEAGRHRTWTDLGLPCSKGSDPPSKMLRKAQVLAQLVPELVKLATALHEHPVQAELKKLIQDPADVYCEGEGIRRLSALRDACRNARNNVFNLLDFDPEQRSKRFEVTPLSTLRKVFNIWRTNFDALDTYLSYAALVEKGKLSGFAELIEQSSSWNPTERGLIDALDHSWFSNLVGQFMASEPVSAFFDGDKHAKLIAKFVKADDRILEANAAEILHKHWQRLPRLNVGGRAGPIHLELEKRSSHTPIRKLLAVAGEAVQRIKPVFMMSAQAVAQHLPQGAPEFDLVIFDQGSQPNLQQAVGPVASGRALYYLQAQDGVSDIVNEENSRITTPFQLVVKEAIEDMGYEVRVNIGLKNPIIDLAVVHPKDPDRYLLAVQLDGPHYQNIESARDRDKIFPLTLSEKNLPLYRVWALAWCNQESREKERLLKAIKAELKNDRGRNFASSEGSLSVQEVREIERDSSRILGSTIRPYQETKIRPGMASLLQVDLKQAHGEEIRLFNERLWADAFKQIVSQEGPIRRDEVRSRINKAVEGWRRIETTEAALDCGEAAALAAGLISVRGEFFFASPEQQIVLRDRSSLRGNLRRLAYVAEEELEAALYTIAQNACGISRYELCSSAARLLGLRLIDEGVDNVLAQKTAELLREGVLSEIDGLIDIVPACNNSLSGFASSARNDLV